MFTRQQVRNHLRSEKIVDDISFKGAGKSRNVPKFLRLKAGRVHHTDLLDVSGPYRALFLWRDGAIFEKKKFHAWLFLANGEDLTPIARMDYHPSHKGLHVHFNCEDERDMTNRALPGVKDLTLGGTKRWDPSVEIDRINLVNEALKCFNISFKQDDEGLF